MAFFEFAYFSACFIILTCGVSAANGGQEAGTFHLFIASVILWYSEVVPSLLM